MNFREFAEKKDSKDTVDDTLLSDDELVAAARELLKNVTVNRDYDIPYLAGYNQNSKEIYIDRHMPSEYKRGSETYNIDKFLVVHETVEKSLLFTYKLKYQHAHQIALRAEKATVLARGWSWEEYDTFCQKYIKSIGSEKINKVPEDLDLNPYEDEKDFELIKVMKKCMTDKKGD